MTGAPKSVPRVEVTSRDFSRAEPGRRSRSVGWSRSAAATKGLCVLRILCGSTPERESDKVAQVSAARVAERATSNSHAGARAVGLQCTAETRPGWIASHMRERARLDCSAQLGSSPVGFHRPPRPRLPSSGVGARREALIGSALGSDLASVEPELDSLGMKHCLHRFECVLDDQARSRSRALAQSRQLQARSRSRALAQSRQLQARSRSRACSSSRLARAHARLRERASKREYARACERY
jgi:hypothetical protein